MQQATGRTNEALEVQHAYQASAVGRLMMGELSSWQEFLEPDTTDWSALPRRELKARRAHVKRSLMPEIEKFCRRNFVTMTSTVLRRLYQDVRAGRGLECTRQDFESRYAALHPQVARGTPAHATVVISLWGLKFWSPEEQLSADLAEALAIGAEAMTGHGPLYTQPHSALRGQVQAIRPLVRRRMFAARSGLLTAFNLLECFLNSLAWDYLRTSSAESLSNRKKRLLEDTSGITLSKKLFEYPAVIAGKPLSDDDTSTIQELLATLKPYRDSLVHASPFSAPERFGGHDKLRLVFRIDVDTLASISWLVVDVVKRIQKHISSATASELELPWLTQLEKVIEDLPPLKPLEWSRRPGPAA